MQPMNQTGWPINLFLRENHTSIARNMDYNLGKRELCKPILESLYGPEKDTLIYRTFVQDWPINLFLAVAPMFSHLAYFWHLFFMLLFGIFIIDIFMDILKNLDHVIILLLLFFLMLLFEFVAIISKICI